MAEAGLFAGAGSFFFIAEIFAHGAVADRRILFELPNQAVAADGMAAAYADMAAEVADGSGGMFLCGGIGFGKGDAALNAAVNLGVGEGRGR